MNYISLEKSVLSILSILFISFTSVAQVAGGHHQKLFDLYVQDKYEDCLGKAQKMTENDKYKSESEPYLWVSMCLYQFIGDDEMETYYPKATKDALKNGVKFKKKDDKIRSKDGDYLFDANEEYIYELVSLALVEGKSFMAMDNYSKASYYYKTAHQLDASNYDCKLIHGVAYLYNRNTRDGQVIVDDCMDYYKAQAEVGGFSTHPQSEPAFVDGFLYYANYLKSKGKNDEAFDVMALAIKLQPKNKKFISLYKELS